MSSEVINLKVHTQFSICEGAVKINQLSEYCRKNNISAVGICDTENLSGALEFSEEISKFGIQPIIGSSIFIKEKIGNDLFYGKISLFAKNHNGYKNLLKLSSKSYLNLKPEDIKPNISFDILKKFSDGIILFIRSKSFFSDLLTQNKDEFCYKEILKLKSIFDKNIYVEIQRHNEPHEFQLEKKLLKISSNLEIPLIATNEVFYLNRDQFAAHDAYICVGEKSYVNEKDRLKYSDQHYFMESHELTNLFKDLPDAIENNQNFKYRFSYFPKKSKPLLPSFIEDDNKVDGLLKDEAQKGLLERLEMFVYPNLENMNKKMKLKKNIKID